MTERELFEAALELPPEDRAAYLDKVCGADAALRQRLEVLLRKHDQAGNFLEMPAPELAQTVNKPAIEEAGTQIGPYKLIEQIGQGGFGLVFVAEQHKPVRRRVALKVIKPGMDTQDVITRFEAERQALALMDHPNIARVLDAGATASGRPYFVMELVRGIPITEYCDNNRLTLRERLELFVSVCQAVQHAHQKGIIHRDIKPSNVLVTVHDARPVVKVIDFGVAKALNQPLTDKTIYTRVAQMVGTPLYMSPEQAERSGLDIDTRSDIYSLGVVLYELLTGTTPFDRKRLSQAAYDELIRIIRQEEPPKPSTRLSRSGELLPAIAAQRKADPARLSGIFRGDLDWITMKALEKDRSRRYETASGLARDVERYLNDEPVEAGPPGAGYRLRKFARKNRAALRIAGAFLMLLVLGAIASTWQAIRATVAEKAARSSEEVAQSEKREADKARENAERQHDEAVANFYHSLVREAQAIRRGHEVGYGAEVRKRLTQALKLASHDTDPQDLRQEAAACLGDFVALNSTDWTDFPASIIRTTQHPNGEQLALGLANGTIQVRRIPSGEVIARLAGHKAAVSALAFRADGNELISGDLGGSVKVWKRIGTDGWACARTFAVEPKLAFPVSPFFASRRVYPAALTADGKSLLVGGAESTIVQMELASGTTVARIHSPKGEKFFWGLALSPDGKLLATGIENNGSYSVLVWDVATRKVVKKISPGLEMLFGVVFSPDSKLLASFHSEGVALYDTATFERQLFVRGDFPANVAFSPDSQLVAIHAIHLGVVRLWNIATNREIATLMRPSAFVGLDFSRNGRFLMSSGGRSLCTWNLAGTGERLVFAGHVGGVPDVVFSPDGQLLVSAGKDHKIKIWNPTTGALIRELTEFQQPIQTLAFSADGRILAAADYETGMLRFYDAASWRRLATVQSQLGPTVWSIAFSPDGRHFAAGGNNGLRLWRVRRDPGDAAGGSSFALAPIAALSKNMCSSLNFSPDGRVLAWAEGLNMGTGKIHLWDVQAARPCTAPTSKLFHAILALGISPDSKRVAFVSRKPAIEVWDIASGQQTSSFGEGELQRRGATPPHTRLSGDGAWYAIGGRVPTIWDLDNKKLLLALPGERSAVWCVAWSPNKEQLAVGTADGGLIVWNVPRVRKQLAEIGLDW